MRNIMTIKRLFELAGVDQTQTAQRLIKKEEDDKKKQDEPKVEEQKPSVEVEQEEKQVQISFSAPTQNPPAQATPPVATGSPAPVEEPVVQQPEVAATTAQPVTAPTQLNGNEVVKMFFEFRDQIHYYHLQTESFAEHTALNNFYETILEIADQFLEAFQGVNGRAQGEVSITLKQYSQEGVISDIKGFIEKVKGLQQSVQTNTDLVNLLDELLNSANKTIYLLTLK